MDVAKEQLKQKQAIVTETSPKSKPLLADIAGSKRRLLRSKVKRPPKKRWWKLIFRLLFSHVGLFCLVCGYASFGAWIFIQIELPNEEQRRITKDTRALEVNDSINYLASLFWYWQDKNYTFDEWSRKVHLEIRTFESYVLNAVEEYDYDGDYGTWEYDWTFAKSLLFTVTILATVGYGHIYPKTNLGRIVVIIYGVVGIPLLLLFLANIGGVMASAFKYGYSRLCCRWCRSRRKRSEYQNGDEAVTVPRSYQRLAEERVGKEDYMPTEDTSVPISLNLFIISLYIVFGAVVFAYWEQWSFTVAVYFTFVTLSTIGLGDYVPGKSFLDYGDSFGGGLRMIFTCLYCTLGMALVSMCITLMQEQITRKVKWVAREVGLTKDEVMAPVPV